MAVVLGSFRVGFIVDSEGVAEEVRIVAIGGLAEVSRVGS